MINTSQDFDSALDFVMTEQDTFNYAITNEMDAGRFNSIFQEMEDDINNLYEKIRVLEDIKNYTRDFVLRAIEERRKKIVDSLKIIETNVTEYQNPEYQVEKISFDNVTEEIKDRDGSVIRGLQNKNNLLMMPHSKLSSERLYHITNIGQVRKVTDASGQTRFVPFSESNPFNEEKLSTFEDREVYRSVYESEQPVPDGILVEYEIQFDGRADCNYFSMGPVNCEIESIELTNADNLSFEVSPKHNFLDSPTDILKARVRVRCKRYDRIVVDMPSGVLEDSFDKAIVGSEMNGQVYDVSS